MNNSSWPIAGSVVAVPAYVFFRHKGIVSDRWYLGKPMVISNSARAGGVAEEPWDVFTSSQDWVDEGPLSSLAASEVLSRARAAPALPYSPIAWNCEDYVVYCYGLPTSSPQLVAALFVTAIAAAVAISKS